MPPLSKSKACQPPKKGSIHRIKLENFMTYRNVEFHPSPGFNVILGPNGSGKSSLVTAIHLAFGGKIKDLKRQKDLEEVIKKGEKEAKITIDLNEGEFVDGDISKKSKLLTVSCKIRPKTNQPNFYINEKTVGLKNIRTLAKNYQIQTSNVCQFLPQEVVSEFAKKTPLEIFQNTLTAIGNMEMLNKHKGLAVKQADMENKKVIQKTKRDTLVDLEAKLKDKQVIKDRVDKRKKLEEDIELHEKCLLRLEIIDTLKKVKHLDTKINEIKDGKDKAKKEIEGLQKLIEDIKVKDDEYKKKNQDLLKQVRQVEQTMAGKNNPVQYLEELIAQKTEAIDRAKNKESSSKKTLEKMKIELKKKRSTIQSLNLKETADALNKETIEISKLEGAINEYEDLLKDQRTKYDLYMTKIAEIRRKLDEKSSEANIKLEILKNRNSDAFKGVQWLRQNKNKFKNPNGVHEPIMMSLKLSDARYAVQVENVIGPQELEAFVCEDIDDCNLLINELRQKQGLRKINVVHCNPDSNRGVLNTSNPPIQDRDVGKVVFLNRVIKCPQAIQDHLCIKKKLNTVPIFERYPSKQLGIWTYFVGKDKFTTIGSDYCKNKSIKREDLKSHSIRYLNKSAADDHESEVNDDLKDIEIIEGKISALQQEMNVIESMKKEKRQRHGNCFRRKENLRLKKETILNEERMILDITKQMKTLEKSANDKEYIKTLKEQRLQHTKSLAEANTKLLEDIKKSFENTVAVERNQLIMQQIELKNQDERKRFSEAKTKLELFTNEEKEKEKEKREYNKMINDYCQRANSWMGKKLEILSDELNRQMEENCPKILPEVKAKKDSLNKELERIPKVSQSDIIDIQTKEKERDNTREEVETLEMEVLHLKKDLQQDREDLMHGINEMVDNINENFMTKMDQIGYAGQVTLKTGEHDLDFKNYGLDIMVKFHGKDALTNLTNHTQSGGEKSVTTALYIMSLQEMTQVPFRCVDEINQGMDERNEKSVWELLVETANQHSSQFFYLAPKYPADLDFDKNIKVHICFNGYVNTETQAYIDIDDVITQMESAKKRKVSTTAGNDDVEEQKK